MSGVGLMVIASVAFLLALNLAGVRYAWTSPPILGLFALTLIVGALFVLRLLTASEPLIPISSLKNRIVRCAIVANGVDGRALRVVKACPPCYRQGGGSLSARTAAWRFAAVI